MRLRARLDRVTKQLGAARAHPLTVVLVEAPVEHPTSRYERTNSAGLAVVEIAYDPASSTELPRPPYKLVAGIDPVDLV
jgi:hypothetical protein